MKALKFMIASFLISGSSCKGEAQMNYYGQQEIESIETSISDDGFINIDIRPILETLYHLAGAKIRESDGRILLSLVRCSVRSKCEVDIPAIVTPGASNPYRIKLKKAENPIDIEFLDTDIMNLYEPDV